MAKEDIVFETYLSLCELETKHEVEVGHAYKTAPSAETFMHYTAEHQCQQILVFLSEKKFYSFLMDGSTDAGKVEQELIVLLPCKKDDTFQEMKSYARLFPIASPKVAEASGLITLR